jgi:hypothetical protein
MYRGILGLHPNREKASHRFNARWRDHLRQLLRGTYHDCFTRETEALTLIELSGLRVLSQTRNGFSNPSNSGPGVSRR